MRDYNAFRSYLLLSLLALLSLFTPGGMLLVLFIVIRISIISISIIIIIYTWENVVRSYLLLLLSLLALAWLVLLTSFILFTPGRPAWGYQMMSSFPGQVLLISPSLWRSCTYLSVNTYIIFSNYVEATNLKELVVTTCKLSMKYYNAGMSYIFLDALQLRGLLSYCYYYCH